MAKFVTSKGEIVEVDLRPSTFEKFVEGLRDLEALSDNIRITHWPRDVHDYYALQIQDRPNACHNLYRFKVDDEGLILAVEPAGYRSHLEEGDVN